MGDVGLAAGEIIVHRKDVVTVRQQPLAQMRAEEAGPAGHQDASTELAQMRALTNTAPKTCPEPDRMLTHK
jgi:hypothetical protein